MGEQTPTIIGIPHDKISEAAKSYADGNCRIHRKNDKGHLSFLCKVVRPVASLVEIDEYTKELFGGGQYLVRVTDPANGLQQIVPNFTFTCEGPPKVKPADVPMAHILAGQAPQFMSAAFQDPNQQQQSMPSDAVAMDQLNWTRQQQKEMQDKLDKALALVEEQRKLAEKRAEAAEKALVETKHQAQLDAQKAETKAWQEKMEAMLKGQQAAAAVPPPAPKMTIADIVALLGAVTPIMAPLATAMVQSGTSKATAAAEAQTKLMEATVKAIGPKNDGGNSATTTALIGILPAVMPLVMKMMDERSPSKFAELISTMGENNMTTLSLVGQFVNSMVAEQPNSPWAPIIQGAIGDLTKVAAQMINVTGQGRPQMAPGQVQPQMTQGQVPTGPTPEQIQAQQEADLAAMRAMKPEDLVANVMASPNLPNDFRTPEWNVIFLALHKKADVETIVEQLATQIQVLEDASKLPALLQPLFQSGTDSKMVLMNAFGGLPISMIDTPYMLDVIGKLAALFVEEDDGEEAEETEGAAEVSEPATVQASPSNGHVTVADFTPPGSSPFSKPLVMV